MPKHEFGTPKDISKRMKAKGLQKLRWYCQMCQKQCRDENGFKCHTMSESHQRQLLLFADNSKKYLGEFSHEFEKGFMDIVRRRFRTKRVHANQVYQEYISDRNHVHMNATSWHSLTGFVKYLGRTGKAIVDETEKGWYLTYIDRDPDTLAAEQKREKKRKMDKDDEEKIMDFVNRQVELNQILNPPSETEYTELKRENEEEPLKLGIQLKVKDEPLPEKESINDDVKSVFGDEKKVAKKKEVKKLTTLDELMLEQESKRERENRKDYWLHEDIVVKVITKSLGDKFYKEKGYVKEVLDKYCCIVKMFDLGQLLKLDQNHLETVIPAIGREVKIVNGAYRGSVATLTGICQDKFCASLSINKGPFLGKQLKNVSYDDICKLYVPSSDDTMQ